MKPVQSWLDEYAESHQNPMNIKIHWVCVPLIMISIIGLLANSYLEKLLPTINSKQKTTILTNPHMMLTKYFP